MRKKNFTSWGMAILFGCCLMFSGCSSEESGITLPEGEGLLRIDLNPKVGFHTKAVDENSYKDVNGYTVKVFKSGQESKPIIEDLYKNLQDKYTLTVGSYMLKAFKGEDKAVSSDVLYFYGEKSFDLKAGEEATVPVTCKPSSARISVAFDPKMDEYFTDYSLTIETEAQKPSSFKWIKETVGPYYFKVKNQEQVKIIVNLTNKENVTAKGTTKIYTLSPADALKINLKPIISNGNLGITITIDDTTVDHPVDIVIPGEWI